MDQARDSVRLVTRTCTTSPMTDECLEQLAAMRPETEQSRLGIPMQERASLAPHKA